MALVNRRSFDGTQAARAVALRELLLELLPKELDHPYCCVLRVLAGLEPGTAGRRREQRQEVAGRALGGERYPVTPRILRRRVKEDCWPRLFDRLIEREVRERRASEVDEGSLPRAASMPPLVLTPHPRAELLDADTPALGTVSAGEFESVLDVAGRMRWLGSVNAEDDALDLLHAAAEDVVARYEAEGPVRLVSEAVQLRRHVQELLHGHQHPRQRQRAYGLAGRLSALVGYMAVNRGRFLLAEAYCAEAFALATAGEDPDLQAWVRGTESFSAYYQKRYTDALELARDGQRYARGGPQAIRLAINGEARALGRLGDHSGVDEAVERAYGKVSEFPDLAGLTPCISFEPYSEARVAANAATAYLSLGATERVLDYAPQIESLVEESDSDWSRSLVRLDIATALVRQQSPDVEHAAHLGMQALQASAGNPIESIRQRAREFAAEVGRWHTRPAIRDFSEALRVWNCNALTAGMGELETT